VQHQASQLPPLRSQLPQTSIAAAVAPEQVQAGQLPAASRQRCKPFVAYKVAKRIVSCAANRHVLQAGAVPGKVLQYDVCYIHVK
jgi:hypothetical protein